MVSLCANLAAMAMGSAHSLANATAVMGGRVTPVR